MVLELDQETQRKLHKRGETVEAFVESVEALVRLAGGVDDRTVQIMTVAAKSVRAPVTVGKPPKDAKDASARALMASITRLIGAYSKKDPRKPGGKDSAEQRFLDSVRRAVDAFFTRRATG